MNSVYDIRQFLKGFGTIIYTGKRNGDLDLLGQEIKELYEWKMIDQKTYQQCMLILKREQQEYSRETQ